MANILQQRTLNEIVTQYSGQYGLHISKAFVYFIIEKYLHHLDLNSIDIEESIVDGSDDCGIDAIVIDESKINPIIYFFQSKYYLSEDAHLKHFEGNAVEKIKSAIQDFVLQGKINSKYQNARLVDKLHSIKNLGIKNPTYVIVFCSNSLEPSAAAKARLEEFVTETNKQSGGNYISTEYLHLDRIIADLVAPAQQKKIDIEVQISGKYLTEDTGNVRLFVGAVEAKDLAQLVEKNGDNLFERNVRGYLRSNTDINKNIYLSATGNNSPYFMYMNNGLTITCEKFSHSPIQNSPTLKIINAQIVNGQQTARSLHKASKEKKLKPDVKVIVRIVETNSPKLLMEIVEATNSQTRVTSRDLHSNDEVQKLIESNLLTKGYFYEARKDKYRGKDNSKRVDAEVAAQAFYAIYSEQPALAKDKKKLLFGDNYESIFNPKKIDPDEILTSFKLLKKVQKFNDDPKFEKYSFLKDATLHTAALMYRISQEKKINIDSVVSTNESKDLYMNAIEIFDRLVQERSEKEKEKYEHRRTFKDPETYGRAVELLIESLTKKKK